MKLTTALILALLPTARAQAARQGEESKFSRAAETVQRQLEESVAELSALRDRIAGEKIPLARRLRELEGELQEVRAEYQRTTRLLDSRTLDLSNLKGSIEAYEVEAGYLSNLLQEYVRNFESRLHIAEIQRYEDALEEARLAPENPALSQEEIYRAQSAMLDTSLDRLFDALSGSMFEGTAVDSTGHVKNGRFVLLGPAALFCSADGKAVGTAEQRLGSLEPTQVAFANPEDANAVSALVASGSGAFPLDPTLGNAHKIEATRETFVQHVQKGGTVMIPIFAMAGAALLVALYKWLVLVALRKPSKRRVEELLDAVGRNDQDGVDAAVHGIRGPVGVMLAHAVEHRGSPPELVEEVMYESVLTTRLRLQRFLPFIAICAASAPLLGLLGTVIGIINTFKLITVFGSGDVKSLSSGISEALITTEFGLIVAIPSLLLHALLSRKAKAFTDQMEKIAVSFVNRLKKAAGPGHVAVLATPGTPPAPPAAADPDLVREQVSEILKDLLDPLVDDAPSKRVRPSSPGGAGRRVEVR